MFASVRISPLSSLADLVPGLWTLLASSALTQWQHLPPAPGTQTEYLYFLIQENQIFLCVFILEIYFPLCRVFLAFLNHSYNLCQFCSLQFLCFAQTTQNKVKSWIGQQGHSSPDIYATKSYSRITSFSFKILVSDTCFDAFNWSGKQWQGDTWPDGSQGRRAGYVETRQWRDLTSDIGIGSFYQQQHRDRHKSRAWPVTVSLCWGE